MKLCQTEENNKGEKEKPKKVLGSKNNGDKQDPQISKDEKLPFKVRYSLSLLRLLSYLQILVS